MQDDRERRITGQIMTDPDENSPFARFVKDFIDEQEANKVAQRRALRAIGARRKKKKAKR